MKTTSLSDHQREKDKISVGGELSPIKSAQNYSLSRFVHQLINQVPALSKEKLLAEINNSVTEWFYPLSLKITVNPEHFLEALIHKSIQAQHPTYFTKHYERLEILGDTILGLLVTEKILNLHPDFSEGQISKFRASLVNTYELREMGQALKLNEVILVGKSELETKEEHHSILADCFEATLAVVYLQSNRNLLVCDHFFEYCLSQYKLMYGQDFFDLEKLTQFDSKTRLQEWAMAEQKILPEYRSTLLQDRPQALFLVELYFNDKKISETTASSKKKGQMKLSRDFLQNLQKEKEINFINQGEKGGLC